MYTEKDREKALLPYDECKSVSSVIQQLRYPSGNCRYIWQHSVMRPVAEHGTTHRIIRCMPHLGANRHQNE